MGSFDDDIKRLEEKYNAYYEKAYFSLDSTSRKKKYINSMCESFVLALKKFKKNGQYGADSIILFYSLKYQANDLFKKIDDAIEENNNSQDYR